MAQARCGAWLKLNEWLFIVLSRLVQCGGLSVVSHRAQEESIVGSDGLGRRMLWSESMFVDGEGPLQQGLGLLVLPLVLIEQSQVVEAGGRVGVQWSQLLLVDGQGAHQQRLGLLVLALCSVEFRQIVEAGGRVGVVNDLKSEQVLPSNMRNCPES
jgi:hypothetical protein